MKNKYWVLFFLLVAFALWGCRPLWDPDEGRYAETSRQMLVSGDWLVPTLAGRMHLTKPPLTYWLGAAGMKVFGVNEWGARFFLPAAFFGSMICIVELARLWGRSERESLFAGLIYATSAIPFAAGHLLTTDALLSFFETLGVLCAWKVWNEANRVRLWRYGFWIAFALAFLTKGPPGWLPLPAILILGFRERRKNNQARLFAPLPFLLFLAISSSWFLALAWKYPGIMQYFLVNEVYDRAFTTLHRRNNPWFIYPPVIILGLFPWIFLWPAISRKTWARMNQLVKSRDWLGRSLPPTHLFLLLWFAIPFIVFTLAKSRLMLYVLPLFAPVCLLAARVLTADWDYWHELLLKRRRVFRVAGLIWLAAMVAFLAYPASAPKSRTMKPLVRLFQEQLGPLDENTQYFWVDSEIKHTAAFYLRRQISELYLGWNDLADYSAGLNQFGYKSVYFARTRDLVKLSPDQPAPRILATDGRFMIFDYAPDK